MHITGACFCGELRYEAVLDGTIVGICHCRDCQVLSGSAFRTSGTARPGDFRITRGQPKYFDKTADSGAVRRMSFCGDCGTHLCSEPLGDDAAFGFVTIRVASADQFEQLQPRAEIYCDSRVSWLGDIDGTARFPTMPGA